MFSVGNGVMHAAIKKDAYQHSKPQFDTENSAELATMLSLPQA